MRPHKIERAFQQVVGQDSEDIAEIARLISGL
jgi:hypothetical protein